MPEHGDFLLETTSSLALIEELVRRSEDAILVVVQNDDHGQRAVIGHACGCEDFFADVTSALLANIDLDSLKDELVEKVEWCVHLPQE